MLFQPHRVYADSDLMAEFAGAFGDADTVQVLDIYAASEEPIAGVTAEALVREIGREGVAYAGSMPEGVGALVKGAKGWGCDFDAGGGECFGGGGDVAGGAGTLSLDHVSDGVMSSAGSSSGRSSSSRKILLISSVCFSWALILYTRSEVPVACESGCCAGVRGCGDCSRDALA